MIHLKTNKKFKTRKQGLKILIYTFINININYLQITPDRLVPVLRFETTWLDQLQKSLGRG